MIGRCERGFDEPMDLIPRIPTATYRLQFHADFTFRDALAIVEYLDELGISDIYTSPYFQAPPESTHGYDVTNHNRINPAIGDLGDFRTLSSALRDRGMGQILDFVPNHMGIGESLNQWWMEVLEEGLASPYAQYFDIDWHPGKAALADRVMLPILGERYGCVLEKGELTLRLENGSFQLCYFHTRLPLRLRSYAFILDKAATRLPGKLAVELRKVSGLFQDAGSKTLAKSRLRELAEVHPETTAAIEQTLRELEGEPGVARSFDELHTLLEQQVYRLGYWKVAAGEINYRRFFDINSLAAIRVEIPEVFDAAHRLVFELLARGDVTGLRIDHIDGLWDPQDYLRRLQDRYAEMCGTTNPQGLYLLVEKILEMTGETLPANWPVHGTTGYEFANQVVQCFTDASAEKRLSKFYAQFTDTPLSFADLAYEKKRQTLQSALGSEMAALGRMLDEISEMHRQFRDYTLSMLTNAVREVMACFPVYRTYASGDRPQTGEEEKQVLRAISAARRRNPAMEKAIFDFLRAVLLLRLPGGLTEAQRQIHFRFVQKFQQCSGPVMAKGVEDTAFYLFNRLSALNEVGGNPGMFGIPIKSFHARNSARQSLSPHTLLATTTHDTKRSEDVRMRLAAISEMSGEWRKAVKRWSKLNRKHLTPIGTELAPSPNEEYLLYQTLLGAWPIDSPVDEEFVKRIQAYMTKALKEGKVNSSWTSPVEEWENATTSFVQQILDENLSRPFREDLTRYASRISLLGMLNSLSQTVLKCTTPGVPDIYQGTEIWDLSLVDPDNRRPVDYAQRRELLKSLPGANVTGLLADWPSGRIKLHFLHTLLRFRRENSVFFREADYQPLKVTGKFQKHIIAFARTLGRERLVVIVPRLCGTFAGIPTGEVWEDTSVADPDGGYELLSRRTLPGAAPSIRVCEALAILPACVLHGSK